LVGGIEGADALDLVTEEIEAKRLFGAARVEVDKAAADGELAGVVDGVEPDIAVGGEQADQLVEPDPLAGGEAGDELADAEAGEGALGGGVDGGDEEAG